MTFDDKTFQWDVSGKADDIYPLTVEEYENAVETAEDVEVE